jgi:hypothetical protein
MTDKQEQRGKLAYENYSFAVGGKAFNGDVLPKWDDLLERIKLAWAIAAKAVAEQVRDEIIKTARNL